MSSGFELFTERARRGGMVPVTRQVVLDGDTPVTAFAKLHQGPYGFLLESLEGGERWARYTFLATDPDEVFRYRGGSAPAGPKRPAGPSSKKTSRPWSTWVGPCGGTRRWRFQGCPASPAGRLATSGYDIVRTIESLPHAPPDDRDLPDAILMVAGTLLVLDNLFNRATVIANVDVPANANAAELARLFDGCRSPDALTGSPGPATPRNARPRAYPAVAGHRSPKRSTPMAAFRTESGGSRSTSRRETPSRRFSPGGWTSPRLTRSSPTAIFGH